MYYYIIVTPLIYSSNTLPLETIYTKKIISHTFTLHRWCMTRIQGDQGGKVKPINWLISAYMVILNQTGFNQSYDGAPQMQYG